MGVLVWLMPMVVAAAEDASPKRSTAYLLPVSLKATSSGDSMFKVGAGTIWAATEQVDMSVTGTYEVSTTNGIATFWGAGSGESGDSLPWTLGVTAAASGISDADEFIGPGDEHPITRAKDSAYAHCKQMCGVSSTPDVKTFCESRMTYLKDRAGQALFSVPPEAFCGGQQEMARAAEQEPDLGVSIEKKLEAAKACDARCADYGREGCTLPGWPLEDPVGFPTENLCAAGNRMYLEAESPFVRRFPPWNARLGMKVGRASFKYREARSQGAGVLLEQSKTPVIGKAGAAFSSILARGPVSLTLEGLANYRSEWTASKEKVSWCRPEGDVPLDDDDPSTTVPSEVCNEAVFKGPAHSNGVQLAAFIGGVDEARGNWRLSAGPDLLIGTGEERFLGLFRINAYLSVATASSENYKGLIRISPAIGVRSLKGKDGEFVAFLELAILGQRLLFSDEFDSL
ncbi:hypothetical protein [Corallococcus sp. AS-1-12]|uniref:hypothetical protein n=1 Tax=Corallococcus sp. AS-1-12 TaxID=2874598 RepID=UPI001CBD9AE1|nr:hypothetical protein [Corallococcus sp. AS-1-12]MBZ4331856.1 hypothetical protein [Corallococcus sp. AS-1-12]